MNRVATTINSYIHVSGEEGATLEEIAHDLGFTPQLVGEVLSGLRHGRHIVPLSITRDTGLLPGSPVWRAK